MYSTAFNESTDRISGQKTLGDLLRARASAHPHRTAVVQDDTSLAYGELLERSSDLAGFLHHLGVAPDDCVGIFVEPSIDLMVGVWGTLLSGGAYLPLSPEYPEERLRYMIEDSGTGVVLAQRGLAARLAGLAPEGTRIVTPDEVTAFARRPHRPGPRREPPEPRPEGLAYVIYTSGSTGKPKGVMIEHHSVVSQLDWLNTELEVNGDTVVLQKTPLSFDAAQWEILAPACGSTVVMGSPGVYRDVEGLVETIMRHGVTTLQCVPTLLQALVGNEEFAACTSLRQIFCGGEALSRSLAAQCIATLPGCELINVYGPTECTINTSAHRVDPKTLQDGPHAISIGTPAHRTEYYILDGEQKPLAVGEIGELHIGGAQLARGYLHRPELTAERFVDNPFTPGTRLFRSGDLAHWNADGTVQFAGRIDNQVKLRGFRVELDEIRLSIENHDWVRNAAMVVRDDPRTGFQNLIAFVELDPREAALMDQGNHGAHHQSKESRLQVRAQLANAGCRDPEEIVGRTVIDLPGKDATERQRRQAFARRTYRFYEGGQVTRDDLLALLAERDTGAAPREVGAIGFPEFGEILRHFGQHLSDQRLLPKYAYASPGSLYATQLYFELDGIGELAPGFYYYHPAHHQLVLVTPKDEPATAPRIRVHFVGKRRAIEPVYKNNLQEVLEIETGHAVGLFEEVLPGHGLTILQRPYTPDTMDRLDCAAEDHYLGSFEITPHTTAMDLPMDVYVQAHPDGVFGLPAGQYRYRDGELERVSGELIRRKHVIAINQQVYQRSRFGISVVSRTTEDWRRYIDLGRTLQRLSMNDLNLGFMPSGYSSRTGADLPAAKRLERILADAGLRGGPSYFFVGGRVSDAQVRAEDMKEDTVHMKGPAEMIRDDLVTSLPDYMIPNRVVVLDKLPATVNGKNDTAAMERLADAAVARDDRPFIAPRTSTEQRVAALWKRSMKRDAVSVHDDFFASGGNSLIAVGLINRINRELGTTLPLQVLFEAPTIEELARRIGGKEAAESSRLVPLRAEGTGAPVFCWPGLGGYPMNLRLLAETVDLDRPFYGVQAHGINPGEEIYPTIQEMAARDVAEIRRRRASGPYTLWGYSFGARVAFEAAHQLEQAGEQVDHLFLIAPGSPEVEADSGEIAYRDRAYVTILFSVFAGRISGPELRECLRVAHDDDSFAAFISSTFPHLDHALVKRIAAVVHRTYTFEYAFHELTTRRITAPVTIFKATGDNYSFIENSAGYSLTRPTVIDLAADHYTLLREAGIDELVAAIRHRLGTTKETIVPHINIKYFSSSLSEEQQSRLVTAVTQAVRTSVDCDEDVISIALEPIEKELWNRRVYVPEIVNRKELLHKSPNY
ncbi:amino acid adenylation domain-containing protein [Streptomyces sp. AA0539]|uniref:amino acid adenylation domain-containing protein n=1 Tax=Streptomyces sp. AA0539 TaxID=1210045 RepID=UPI0002F32306|nr:amino acid adenylation domain-containing protein [Streptomyces sp. AA0539]